VQVILYNIFLFLFRTGMSVGSLFHHKAALGVRGRKRIFERMRAVIPSGRRIVWMHCASLGEFEQGRPLLEAIRSRYPQYAVLLTFFSPSGYETQKDYKGADWVFYLPLDGPSNARRFLDLVNPELVLFVKYEFWYYYLKKLQYRGIPVLLVSALFRKDMSFFKWYGGLQRKMLSRFRHLFVQNADSGSLLDGIGLGRLVSVSGDTRFDRVEALAGRAESLPFLETFADGRKLIIAGSTWREDVIFLQRLMAHLAETELKLVIAPHEISTQAIQDLQIRFPGAVRYSQQADPEALQLARVLIIDTIGLLSRLYRYAFVSFVGGGFRPMGIHNVLEPAAYGRPVLFGPRHEKYPEADGLLQFGGARVVEGTDEAALQVRAWLKDTATYDQACEQARRYIKAHAGAVNRILTYIQENRLLTS
jgi:3-deoxy-D-manno-octulosonic-acid transferase